MATKRSSKATAFTETAEPEEPRFLTRISRRTGTTVAEYEGTLEQRGVFRSLVKLQAAINRFLAETNDDPNPSCGPPIPIRSSLPSNVVPSVRFDLLTIVCRRFVKFYTSICRTSSNDANKSCHIW